MAPIVGSGLVAFAIVFSGFLIYLAAAPTTYRTTAMVAVEYAPEVEKEQPEPLEAARRLREAALDRELLAKLAQGEAKSATAEAWAAAASRIRGAFEVDTLDGKAFAVSFRDAEAERTERICNQLAERVVARAPEALLSGRAQQAAAEHDRDVDRFTAFMLQHPEVAREPGGARDATQAADPAKDVVLKALKGEKAVIEKQLATAPGAGKPASSDNPYGEPEPAGPPRLDPDTLRRRLNEISGAIATRQKAMTASSAAPNEKVAPEVAAEWKRLLAKVKSSEGEAEAKPAAPAVSAKISRSAPFPETPLEPNRGRLLTFATLLSTITGIVFALVRSVTPARRRRGSASKSRADSRPAEATASHRPELSSTRPAAPSQPPPVAPEPVRPPPRTEPGPMLAYAPTARDLALHAGPMTPAPILTPAPLLNTAPLEPLRPLEPVTVGRAIIEVNAPQDSSSGPPPENAAPVRSKVTRTTQVLGSPLPSNLFSDSEPPVAPVGLAPARASAAPAVAETTGYSYVSSDAVPAATVPAVTVPATPAPAVILTEPPQSRPVIDVERAVESQATRRDETPFNGSTALATTTKAVTLTIQDAPPNWAPDPALVPAGQRALVDKVLQRASSGSVVVGLSGPAGASDAKARVAAELALGLAESRRARVLLMEGNLQRPAVHRWLKVSMPLSAGLSLQLNARSDRSIMRPWAVLQCTPALHVLAEGVMRSPGLILSQAFYECVKELKTCYDVVVIDGPLMSDAVECRAFDSLMDTLVLVTQKSQAAELVRAEATFTRPLLSEVWLPG